VDHLIIGREAWELAPPVKELPPFLVRLNEDGSLTGSTWNATVQWNHSIPFQKLLLTVGLTHGKIFKKLFKNTSNH